MLRTFDQTGCMRQSTVLVADILPFARFGSELIELANLPFKTLTFL
jgi:hypothetical protein